MIKKIREEQRKRIIEVARVKNASRIFSTREAQDLLKNSWVPVYAFEILGKERLVNITKASS